MNLQIEIHHIPTGKISLPAIPPLSTIAISISIVIGHFSLFYLIFDERFVKRYKEFNAAFEIWKATEVNEFKNRSRVL